MVEIFGMVLPVIYVHLGVIPFLFITIVLADKQAFSWITGKRTTLCRTMLNRLHTFVWAGLLIMIISGAVMAWPLKGYLVHSAAFYAKMFFVLALVVNSFFIGRFMKVAIERPFASLSSRERFPILISGAVSTASWVGAFVSALYMSTSGWIVYIFSSIF